MALTFEIQNQKVQQWATDTNGIMKATGTSYGIQHRANSSSNGDSLSKIRSKLIYKDGSVSAVAFSFNRSLIHPQMGSGRGQGGAKGSRWRTKEGVMKRTNPESLGKAGTGNRAKKPFINVTLDKQVPVLADIVANTSADIITANLFKQ